MIERIAVQIDQLDKHLQMAAQMLDNRKVQKDRYIAKSVCTVFNLKKILPIKRSIVGIFSPMTVFVC